MSQQNSHLSRQATPSKQNPYIPTKTGIFQWVHTVLPFTDKSLTIQSLGNGVIYCRIINHYIPNSILQSRIITNPLNQYENCLNLKQAQQALAKLKINIPFDISRVSKQRFVENWNLVVLIYKHLVGGDNKKINEEKVLAVTPKRSHSELPIFEKEHILEQNRNKENKSKNIVPEVFQRSGLVFMVDRVKEILISNYNDTYKIQLIRKLFSLEEVKVQENQEEYRNFMPPIKKVPKKQ